MLLYKQHRQYRFQNIHIYIYIHTVYGGKRSLDTQYLSEKKMAPQKKWNKKPPKLQTPTTSKSPRRKRDEVDNVRGKVGLKFKVTNVNKPSSTNSGSSFPPLQNYSFEEVDRYKDRNHRYGGGGGGRENKDVNRVFVPHRPTMT